MAKYAIMLKGCDDETCFGVELTEQEAAAVMRVADCANKTSRYGCMPKMEVIPWEERDDWYDYNEEFIKDA